MSDKSKKVARIAYLSVLHLLAVFGIILIGIIIYWWPVIDRLYIRPCHYYPHTFADCKSKGE